MTRREATIVSAYTGYFIGELDDLIESIGEHVNQNKSNPENEPKGDHHEKSMEKPKPGLLPGRDGGERKLDTMDPARVAAENVSGRSSADPGGAAERVEEG